MSKRNSVLLSIYVVKTRIIFNTDTSDVIFFNHHTWVSLSFFCRLHISSSLDPFEFNLEYVICPYKQFYTIATVILQNAKMILFLGSSLNYSQIISGRPLMLFLVSVAPQHQWYSSIVVLVAPVILLGV